MPLPHPEGALYEAFMQSHPHRDNILGKGFRRVGVGVYAHGRGASAVRLIFVG